MKVLYKTTKWAGKFLNLHHYHLDDGRIYEVCSRKVHPNPEECDAVDIIAFNKGHKSICIIQEYRPAVEGFVFAFPAGLREQGEDVIETARRELWEECGLKIATIDKVLPPSFQSPGMSDESCATVICTVENETELTAANASGNEMIHPYWYTKERVREMLNSPYQIPMSVRCQIFLAAWSGHIML